jgi:replicative DNA helicase
VPDGLRAELPVPPQNPEAEESVIGAMMLSPQAIDLVTGEVHPEDFYKPSHGLIFKTALSLAARGEPVDAITLVAELERNGKIEQVGGRVRIHELAAMVPAWSNAAHYARLVRETATRRRMIDAGAQIIRAAQSGVGEVTEIVAHAEQYLSQVTAGPNAKDFSGMDDAADTLLADITQAVETATPIFGARTGFPDLDTVLSGLHPGQLVVVAARPGVGKSLFSQNVSENLADRGTPVAFFSLEMSKRELLLRSLVRKTKIDLNRIRTGRLTEDELKKIGNALPAIKSRPLYVEDDATIGVSELRSRARRLKQKNGLGLLVVDYLQLMVNESAHEKKNDQVAALSRALKLLAKELEVPVIAVSQLNRNTEYRSDKRPTLADLRDSGAIEQDADVVLFLYREEVYRPVEVEKGGDAEIIVAKNRMGETKTVNVLFLGRRQTFASPAMLPGTGQVSDAA